MASDDRTVISPLLVPSSLYGRTTDVRRTAGRFVTSIRKGGSIRDALSDNMVAVDDNHPGLIVLDRRSSSIGTDKPHFHIDLPWRRLSDVMLKVKNMRSFERASREALTQPWSFIGLLGGQLYEAVRSSAAQLHTLKAAALHWSTLASVGARYTQGSNVGELLADMHTLVTFCLARQGADVHDLRDLTPTRLHKHIAHLPGVRIRALLEVGDVTSALSLLEGHQGIPLLSLAEHFLNFGHDDVASSAVTRISTSDPHGNVTRWSADRGNFSRLVQ